MFYSKVQEAFQSSDIDESGFVDKDRLLHICHLIHLPLADQLILALMEKYNNLQCNTIIVNVL